jgi:hypothetical protein
MGRPPGHCELGAVLRTGDDLDAILFGHPYDAIAAEKRPIDFNFRHALSLEFFAMVEEEAKLKRWHVLLKGIGVGFPSPETLHQDLIKRAGGAIEVLDRNTFEVHGASNFYTIDAPASFDAEELKDLVSASVRVYVPKSASYTVEITSTKD